MLIIRLVMVHMGPQHTQCGQKRPDWRSFSKWAQKVMWVHLPALRHSKCETKARCSCLVSFEHLALVHEEHAWCSAQRTKPSWCVRHNHGSACATNTLRLMATRDACMGLCFLQTHHTFIYRHCVCRRLHGILLLRCINLAARIVLMSLSSALHQYRQ